MAIARIWTGATTADDADRYLEYLRRTGLSAYAATPGHEAVYCLRRIDGDEAEFTLVSFWRDRQAVEAFAGPEPDRAVFYPEDEAFLVRREPTVRHYEVAYHAVVRGRPGRLERLVRWWVRHAAAALPAPRAVAKVPRGGLGDTSAGRVRHAVGDAAA